jgi:hypothetical protein
MNDGERRLISSLEAEEERLAFTRISIVTGSDCPAGGRWRPRRRALRGGDDKQI